MKLLGNANVELSAGDPQRLGAQPVGRHMNFAVAVPGAEEVILHISKEGEQSPEFSVVMEASERSGAVFSVLIKNFSGRGRTYRYETKGCSFVDPCAKRLIGREVYGKVLTHKERSALCAPVWTSPYDWKEDRRPEIPFSDLIIYKLHVRGFSMRAGVAHKGTFRGVTERISYLKQLGINAVLLMPCLEFNEVIEFGVQEGVPNFTTSKFYKSSVLESNDSSESVAVRVKRKINFWGYTPHYFFFAPKASYASEPSRADTECKEMIRRLHKEGIEVLLEMNLPADISRSFLLEALRFWVREYHIDGFRLNLEAGDAKLLAGDPYLARTKLLGYGWEGCAESGTRNLAFCTDGFQMDCRRFLKGDEGMAGAFLHRVTENLENFGTVNYITDHNGFTLADLYQYDVKHNEANGENGRDGTDDNGSWNCGVEGPDKRKRIRELRLKMKKNALMTLLLSQGTPLLLAGDEVGNSQGGNNNAYCQDNAVGWVDWKSQRANAELYGFIRELIAFRKAHPVLHNANGLRGNDYLQSGCPDVSCHSTKIWYPDESRYNRCVAVLLSGAFAKTRDGKPDDSIYLIFNMYWEERAFDLPFLPGCGAWELVFSSDRLCEKPQEGETSLLVPPRTAILLLCKRREEKTVREKRGRKGAGEGAE